VVARNVKVKKFNQARVNGGSNYDSLKVNWLAFVSMKVLASRLGLSMARPKVRRHHRTAGTSLELKLPNQGGNTLGGQGNDLGYGKNA
jgi:hypothetical protein